MKLRPKLSTPVLLFLLATSLAQAQGAKPVQNGSSSLDQARHTLLKSRDSSTIRDTLQSLAGTLLPSDAIVLYKEFIPKIPAKDRFPVLLQASKLSALCGQYQDAAYFYSEAGKIDSTYKLMAARFFLAVGETDSAKKQVSEIPKELREGKLASPVGLLEGWIELFSGNAAKTLAISETIQKAGGSDGGVALEALFMAWLAAGAVERNSETPPSGMGSAQIAKKIENDFPDSIEAGIVEGKAATSASAAFVFSSLISGKEIRPAGLAAPSAAQSPAQAGPPKPAPGPAPAPGPRGTPALQVGWFSVEKNATSLAAALTIKKFKASVEKQVDSNGKARWAVVVDAGPDWGRTQAELKAAGYESYLVGQ